jgi:hypothetical protein
MKEIAECHWNGAKIPTGWQLSPAERKKIESTEYPLCAITPWNKSWGDNFPSGFVICDGRKHGDIQTPDLQDEGALVVYICQVGGV